MIHLRAADEWNTRGTPRRIAGTCLQRPSASFQSHLDTAHELLRIVPPDSTSQLLRTRVVDVRIACRAISCFIPLRLFSDLKGSANTTLKANCAFGSLTPRPTNDRSRLSIIVTFRVYSPSHVLKCNRLDSNQLHAFHRRFFSTWS